MHRRPISCRGLALVVLLLPCGTAAASSSGINSFSGNPATQGGNICNVCHSGGVAPTVTLSGPQTVSPGSTHRYTLLIRGGQEIAGGLDVSVTGGALSAIDAGTRIFNFELTQSEPRDADLTGDVTFEFDWTAPMSEGPVTMYGAGNSVNLAQATNGDAASADVLAIDVQGVSATPGETSGAGLTPMLVTGHDASTSSVSVSYDTGCGTTDNNIYYGPLADVSIHGYTGAVCDVGTGGTTTFTLPDGSYFFVIVGDNDTVEGSYGTDGARLERPPSGGCGLVQDLGNTCPQP